MPLGKLPAGFKAMLCAQKATMNDVRFPAYASTKYDGIRCLHNGECLTSRELIDTTNTTLIDFGTLFQSELAMMDCEFIVGPANAPNVCSVSGGYWGGNKHSHLNFKLFAFDLVDHPRMTFVSRQEELRRVIRSIQDSGLSRDGIRLADHVVYVEQHLVHDKEALEDFYTKQLENGYEGVVTAFGLGPYKFGRSTINEGWRLKLKPRETSEARIMSMYEAETNLNEATKDHLGHTKRSTAQAGKVAKGTCGGFTVQDIVTGKVFNLGGGKFFTDRSRRDAWENFESKYKNRLMTYSFCPIGVKDLPRQPQAEQLRQEGT